MMFARENSHAAGALGHMCAQKRATSGGTSSCPRDALLVLLVPSSTSAIEAIMTQDDSQVASAWLAKEIP
jgi:hypothetical protein